MLGRGRRGFKAPRVKGSKAPRKGERGKAPRRRGCKAAGEREVQCRKGGREEEVVQNRKGEGRGGARPPGGGRRVQCHQGG